MGVRPTSCDPHRSTWSNLETAARMDGVRKRGTSLFEVWPPSVAFGAYNQHSNLSHSAHCTTFLLPAPLPLSITPRPWNDNQYDSTSIAVTPLHTQHQHHHRQWLGQRTRCGLTRPRWSTAPWSCTGWAPGAYWCRWRRASARPSSSRTFLRYAHALKVRFLPAVVRGVYFCVYMQVLLLRVGTRLFVGVLSSLALLLFIVHTSCCVCEDLIRILGCLVKCPRFSVLLFIGILPQDKWPCRTVRKLTGSSGFQGMNWWTLWRCFLYTAQDDGARKTSF